MQKIKLIRSLLSKPDLLLLDEVFANLDKQTIKLLIEHLNIIKLTTLFVYHGEIKNLPPNFSCTNLGLDEYNLSTIDEIMMDEEIR